MADNASGSGTSFIHNTGGVGATAFDINRNMTDNQFRQTWTQLQTAASTFASPVPQTANSKTYMKNLHNWSTAPTPPPGKNATTTSRSSRSRTTRSNVPSTPTPIAPVAPAVPTVSYQQVYQPQQPAPLPAAPPAIPNPPRAPLQPTPQTAFTTYSSRLKTGVSLLVQPTFASSSLTNARTTTRRGGVINYADPGSGDDLPDAGAIDSEDSDFVASGGTRTSIRHTRRGPGLGVFNSNASTPRPISTPKPEKAELGQSYLGMRPPASLVKPRYAPQNNSHEYFSPDAMEHQAARRTSLVPIRVEFETETHRIRDCFVWNINEKLIKPETFAKMFCLDLDIPLQWQETIANQIRAQIEDHEGVASMEIGLDGALEDDMLPNGEENPECRVMLEIDVQIANHHLVDYIEWDLLSPLTPEEFSIKLCAELGLTGEAIPLISHAVHEELMKHKRDAIEWGVIGGERDIGDDSAGGGGNGGTGSGPGGGAGGTDKGKTGGGFGTVKDKTGLGFSWGRAPRDGRGPKTLKSVWRDWTEAEEFRTKFEELTAEEVERRETERERASRRLRRETSKFQSSTRSRRR